MDGLIALSVFVDGPENCVHVGTDIVARIWKSKGDVYAVQHDLLISFDLFKLIFLLPLQVCGDALPHVLAGEQGPAPSILLRNEGSHLIWKGANIFAVSGDVL